MRIRINQRILGAAGWPLAARSVSRAFRAAFDSSCPPRTHVSPKLYRSEEDALAAAATMPRWAGVCVALSVGVPSAALLERTESLYLARNSDVTDVSALGSVHTLILSYCENVANSPKMMTTTSTRVPEVENSICRRYRLLNCTQTFKAREENIEGWLCCKWRRKNEHFCRN